MTKVLFFILLFCSVANANVIDDFATYENYINQLQKDIKEQNKYLKDIENSKKNLISKIDALQKKIASQEETVRVTSISLKKLNQQINEIEEKIMILDNDINILSKQIEKFNIYLIDNRNITSIKILLFSKDFYTLIKNMEIVEKINIKIKEKIAEINGKKNQINSLKVELELRNNALQRILALKETTLNDLKNEKIKLSQLSKILQEDEESKKEYIKLLNEKHNELQSKLEKIKPQIEKEGGTQFSESSFFKSKGKLPWPATGKVIEHYGPKKINDFNGEVFIKGIKIKIEDEGYVKSVFDGVVKYVDWVRGYGNIVIVKHDEFFYTLYAGLDEIFVTIDQKVKVNEKIGLIDVDVKDISPYLYFEIRKQDTAVDPEKWLIANGGTND
ncbi:peptidoglycan DD-metalloendopeptidase family protein [Deferribacteraceae bacterium V6Fe1]|nr:peptidoglycan DD-metalloendopeptidase family protein [Deferribacteraceae bacterium V6Fe1]